MAASAERRIVSHDELKARAQEKAQERAQEQLAAQEKAQEQALERVQELAEEAAGQLADMDQQDEAAEASSAAILGEVSSGPDVADDAEAAAQQRPEHLRLLEALLFAASTPLDEKTLAARLPEDIDVRASLRTLQLEYAPRGVNLVKVGNKWTFRTAADLSWLLTKEQTVPKKLSRAAIETLAVIAYHQPVTRVEVEEIRGVAMSKGTFDVLMETGWIRPRGRRKVPGRPITYGTSDDFLSHFGLETLTDLPGMEELKGSGLLDSRMPAGFAIPSPSDDPMLRDDEDPLEPGDLDLGLAPPAERIED